MPTVRIANGTSIGYDFGYVLNTDDFGEEGITLGLRMYYYETSRGRGSANLEIAIEDVQGHEDVELVTPGNIWTYHATLSRQGHTYYVEWYNNVTSDVIFTTPEVIVSGTPSPSGEDPDQPTLAAWGDIMDEYGYTDLSEHANEYIEAINSGRPSPDIIQAILNCYPRGSDYTRIAEYLYPQLTALFDAWDALVGETMQDLQENQDLLAEQLMDAFGEGFDSGLGFLRTNDRLRQELLDNWNRPNIEPAGIYPWECRIGLSKFVVPPLNINVSQSYRTGSLSGGAIRQRNTAKFNSGHSETIVSMTLYFPNHESMWGTDENLASTSGANGIDFVNGTDAEIDDFMSSLRGLVAQFKYSPILPIRNAYLNSVHGITGVVLHSMSVRTIEDFPFSVAVDLQLLKFNHSVYLPMVQDFHQAIHWGRFRQYIGRGVEKLNESVQQGFLIETPTSNHPSFNVGDDPTDGVMGPGTATSRPEGAVSVSGSPESIIHYERDDTSGFHKMRDIREGKNFDLYYPSKTPAKVFAPDISTFRHPLEDSGYERERNLWEGFLGALGIDVDRNPDAGYDNMYENTSGNIGNSDFNERQLLYNWLLGVDQANETTITVDNMTLENLEAYIEHRQEQYENRHGPQTDEQLHALEDAIRIAWFQHMFSGYRDTPFFRAFLQHSEFSEGQFIIKEWDVPMEKASLDWSKIIVNGVAVSLSNNVARMQVQLQEEPTHQHIGGGDSQVEVSMTVFGEEELAKIQNIFSHISGLARLEHAHGVLGFLGVKNVITALCGVKYLLPLNMEQNTIPDYPGVYSLRLSFVDFDVFQQRREALSSEQQQELVDAFGKRNPFLRIKQLWGAFNAYPDFPLAVKDEDDKIIGHLDPDFYFRSWETADNDIFEWSGTTRVDLDSNFQPENPRQADLTAEERENDAPPQSRKVLRNHALKTYFGPHGSEQERISVIRVDGAAELSVGHVEVGGQSMNSDGSVVEEYQSEGLTFREDNPDQSLPYPTIPGLTPYGDYNAVYADESANPATQFQKLMEDAVYRDISGRMVRAFPTYMLWLIDEGGIFAGVKLFDNFYGLQSIMDLSLNRSEDTLGDTLVFRVSNLYKKLTTPYPYTIPEGRFEEDDPLASVPTEPLDVGGAASVLINSSEDILRNIFSGTTHHTVEIEHVRLKPGVRVHLRMGYSANPNSLETVFNGVITQVQQGDVLEVIAQSDAVELSPLLNSTEEDGHSGDIDGAFTGLWMSEPRDLMVRLLSMGSTSFKEQVAHATEGFVFSENAFGVRHFGQILYEPLTDQERQRQDARYNTVQEWANATISAEDAAEFVGSGFEAISGGNIIRSPVISLLRSMWTNWIRGRDYELFKRNIYPGNGTGIAQYLGGDTLDGGLLLAVNADRTNLNQINAVDAIAAQNIIANEGNANTTNTADNPIDTGPDLIDAAIGIGGSLVGGPLGGLFAGVFGTQIRQSASPLAQMLGITSMTEDDLAGMDEVSFRASTYMKSIWDMFKLCAHLLPNYIVAVRPFEDRSTVFYGKPHWMYTSGVVPLSTGIPPNRAIAVEAINEELARLQDALAEEANPLADLEEQLSFLEGLDTNTNPYDSMNGMAFPGSAGPLVGRDNQEKSFNFFRQSGLSGQASAGIVGNLMQESGADINPTSTGGSGSTGIAQWLGGRKDNLNAFANAHRQNVGTLEIQLKFIWFEMTGSPATPGVGGGNSEATAYAAIRNSTNVAEATEQFCTLYERAGTPHMEQRIAYAEQVFRQYGGTPIPNSGTADDTSGGGGDSGGGRGGGSNPHLSTFGNQDGGGLSQLGLTGGRAQGSYYAELELLAPEWLPRNITTQFPDMGQMYLINPLLYAFDEGHNNANVPLWIDPESDWGAEGELSDEARKLYEENYSESVDAISGGNRTLEQANDIWYQFRTEFHTYDAVEEVFREVRPLDSVEELEAPDEGRVIAGQEDQIISLGVRQHLSDFERIMLLFKKFMWQDPWNRAWLVTTADKHLMFGNDLGAAGELAFDTVNLSTLGLAGIVADPLSDVLGGAADAAGGAVEGVRNLFGGGDGPSFTDRMFEQAMEEGLTPDQRALIESGITLNDSEWDFNRATEAWEVFLRSEANGGVSIRNNKVWSQETREWMIQHSQPGSDADSHIEAALDSLGNAWDATIGKLLTAVGGVMSGLITAIRNNLMQLGFGLEMLGHMQQEANVLNRIFNDSIYYAAGPPGTLVRAADNPFTREYGEPVVEIREPFQRMHFLSSFQHILGNQITENTNGVATVITATSDAKYPVTVYFDRGAPSNFQNEKAIETGLIWDNARGSGWDSFLHPLVNFPEVLRANAKTLTGSSDELLSRRVALSHLKESLKDIYTGQLTIMGDPDIRPYDLVYLADVYERMYGMFEVEEVTHHITPEHGFITEITPNAIVTVNDPARWSLISYVRSWWSVKNMRDDTRQFLGVYADAGSVISSTEGVTPASLAEALSIQMEGGVQYTQGASALASDLASYAATGLLGAEQAARADLTNEDFPTGLAFGAGILGGFPIVGDLVWSGWEWIRDNLLDQHGCYIQYLTIDGKPMDAGLSYAQGVAVGRHHSVELLPSILGVSVDVARDNHRRITSNDLLQALGWNEVQINQAVRDISLWVNETNANILELAGDSPDPGPSQAPTIITGIIEEVIDADTVKVAGTKIRLAGVAAPELQFKHDGYYDLNRSDSLAFEGYNYVNDNYLGRPVAVRVDPQEPLDQYGRTLGVIFHNPPNPNSENPGFDVEELAKQTPFISWDSYLEDGRPVTLNWELIIRGFASTDLGGLRFDPERGVVGLGPTVSNPRLF